MIGEAIDTAVLVVDTAVLWVQILSGAAVFTFIVTVFGVAMLVAQPNQSDAAAPRRALSAPVGAEVPESGPRSLPTLERRPQPRWASPPEGDPDGTAPQKAA